MIRPNNVYNSRMFSGNDHVHNSLNEMLNNTGNEICADCRTPINMDNAHAVVHYGVFVCDDCNLVHIEIERTTMANENNSMVSNEVVLPVKSSYGWTETRLNHMKNHGNVMMNKKYMEKFPVWQYYPCGSYHGIKLKEHWIKTKYLKNDDNFDVPKMYNEHTLLAIQFDRPKSRDSQTNPCCAVLKSESEDVLYLSSNNNNSNAPEELPIHCIETLVVNSKRIAHDNGIQIAYRVNNDANNIAVTFLQHANMDTVVDWIILILYLKYKIFKKTYPQLTDQRICKFLNFTMIKESYMPIPGHGLVFISLSEARLCCFKHHLDNEPVYQIAICSSLKLKSSDYLDHVAYFFGIEPSKLQCYNEWLNAIEQVLTLDKMASLPDDVPKPSVPPPVKDNHVQTCEKPATAVAVSDTETLKDSTPSTSISSCTKTTIVTINKNDGNQQKELECYPPIGPMGEMGKVFRGEIPADAIKPPLIKNDLTRSTYDIPASVSHTTGLKDASCYPPIHGPPDLIKLRYENPASSHPLRRDPSDFDIRNGNLTNLLTTKFFRNNPAANPGMYDAARITASNLNRLAQDPLALAANQAYGTAWDDRTPNGMMNGLSLGTFQNHLNSPLNGFDSARGFHGNPSTTYDALQWGAWPGNAARHANMVDFPTQSLFGRLTQTNTTPSWPQNLAANGLASQMDWMQAANAADPLNGLRNILAAQTQQPVGGGLAPSDLANFSNKINFQDNGLANALSGLTLGNSTANLAHSMAAASGNHTNNPTLSFVAPTLNYRWKQVEEQLNSESKNAKILPWDLREAGLDQNNITHAETSMKEIFDLILNNKINLALSFVKSFREIYSNSHIIELRSQYLGLTELEILKNAFFRVGREKLTGPDSQAIFQKLLSPPPVTPVEKTSADPSVVDDARSSWSTSRHQPPSSTTTPSDLSSETFNLTSTSITTSSVGNDNNWSFAPISDAANINRVWGDSNMSSSRLNLPDNLWGSSRVFSNLSGNSNPSFNRAPSRPPNNSLRHNSVADNFATDGSKASSQSTSPNTSSPSEIFNNAAANLGGNSESFSLFGCSSD